MSRFCVILLLLCAGFMLRAQDPAYSPDTLQFPANENYVLTITRTTKPKTYIVPVGKKMIIWMGEEKVSGHMTAITADSIYLDSLAYAPRNIDKVRVQLPQKAAGGTIMILGGVAAGGGGIALIVGSLIFISESTEAFMGIFGVLVGLVGVIVGAAITGGGVALTTIGIIIVTHGKLFDLHKNWSLSIVPQNIPPPLAGSGP